MELTQSCRDEFLPSNQQFRNEAEGAISPVGGGVGIGTSSCASSKREKVGKFEKDDKEMTEKRKGRRNESKEERRKKKAKGKASVQFCKEHRRTTINRGLQIGVNTYPFTVPFYFTNRSNPLQRNVHLILKLVLAPAAESTSFVGGKPGSRIGVQLDVLIRGTR